MKLCNKGEKHWQERRVPQYACSTVKFFIPLPSFHFKILTAEFHRSLAIRRSVDSPFSYPGLRSYKFLVEDAYSHQAASSTPQCNVPIYFIVLSTLTSPLLQQHLLLKLSLAIFTLFTESFLSSFVLDSRISHLDTVTCDPETQPISPRHKQALMTRSHKRHPEHSLPSQDTSYNRTNT